MQFADLLKNRKGPTARLRDHPFDRVCHLHGIDHRWTKPNHPWTNGSGRAREPPHQRNHGSVLLLAVTVGVAWLTVRLDWADPDANVLAAMPDMG